MFRFAMLSDLALEFFYLVVIVIYYFLMQIQGSNFCKIDMETLNGFSQACDSIINKKNSSGDLIDQINEAAATQVDVKVIFVIRSFR